MPSPDPTPDQPPARWLQPAVHPVYARLVCAELRRRGHSEEAILAGTRLDWQTLHVDNRFLSFEQLRRLVRHAMAISGCPWLGIDVGSQAQVSMHGALGQAISASPTLGDALVHIQRFMPIRQRAMAMHFDTRDGLALVGEELLMTDDVREMLVSFLACALLQVVETLGGVPIRAGLTIDWPFPEPPWAERYAPLAASNRFGQPHLRATLTPELLRQPTLAADPEALRIALRECERQLRQQKTGGSLTQRVQQQLADSQGQYPSLEEVADAQGMSVRTLSRRLDDEGTSYQQLLDDVREELACWLLLQTPLSVEAIAERLGYGDTSNFSRTFRRWVGMTPREFRAGGEMAPTPHRP